MNILILGGGAREHALAWAVRQNPKCDRLIVAPGNAGIARLAECAAIDILDAEAVLALAETHAIGLVVIGPEAPLAAGIADAVEAAGIRAFGPSAAAARLEASKAFAKEVCAAAGAPTAAARRFTDAAAAEAHVAACPLPAVVKADGLAAGKGVIVAETRAEARAAVAALLAVSPEILVEDFLDGEEASFFVLSDGETALPVGTAQDHKRALDGDAGPMTGGMGAYSPAPVLTDAVAERAMDRIVRPVLAEMARRGAPFRGVLYAGLMIDDGEPALVEFNVRFGDPEAQVLMLRLGGQILDLMIACAERRLAGYEVAFAPDHALGVVLAADGYPGSPVTGTAIGGLDALPEDSFRMTFHAATARRDGATVATGGRALTATARGATLAEARDRAYALADAIDWDGGFFRRDIGWRALT